MLASPDGPRPPGHPRPLDPAERELTVDYGTFGTVDHAVIEDTYHLDDPENSGSFWP